MTPMKKLAIVAAVQLVMLFGIVGFKQYTLWTGTIVVLSVESIDPAGADNVTVRYVISEIELGNVAVDDYDGGPEVFVELQEDAGGVWEAVAVHSSHKRSFGGTVLIKGDMVRYEYVGIPDRTMQVDYDLEDLSVSGAGGRDIPWDRGVLVEIKVDRFGNSVPRHLLVDGEKLDLRRR